MRYATAYDVGDRKRRRDGINEDSVAVAVFEDGHREGYDPAAAGVGPGRPAEGDGERTDGYAGGDASPDADAAPTVRGPRDRPAETDADPDTTGGRGGADEDRGSATTRTRVFDPDEAEGEDGDDGDEGDAAGPRNRRAGVFVLADGAGGEQAGDVASYVATTVVVRELSRAVQNATLARPEGFGVDLDPGPLGGRPGPDDVETAVVEAVAEAGRSLVEYAGRAGLERTYTTVVAGVALDGRLHYGWVGDSRLYLVNGGHGRIERLTRDHSKVARLADRGEIDAVEAHVHPDGNELSRALGGGAGDDPGAAADRARRDVETGTVDLYGDDVVLLTSDGLVDAQTDYRELYEQYVTGGRTEAAAEAVLDAVVTDDRLREAVLSADSLSAAADRLIEVSNRKGGKDNVSVVVAADDRLPGAPPDPPDRSADLPDPPDPPGFDASG